MTSKTIGAVCLCGWLSASPAQAQEHSDLYAQIKQADARFFAAFNACDIDTLADMFSPQLEFYHDKSGLSNYAQNMAATQKLCDRQLGLVRTLNEQSMQVYPVPGFGAMQIGGHTFCHQVDSKQDCGTFGFTNIWQRTDSGWLLHRVASYGH